MGAAADATTSSGIASGLLSSLVSISLPDVLRKFLLMQFPYEFEICLFAFCLGASMRVRPSPQHSWLHHLVLVFLTGFAGGIIIPMFFGRTPALFVNDVLVPLVILSWYLVHNTRFGGWLQSSPAKYVLVCLFEMYRAASIVRTVGQVATDIPPGPYYPIPLVGPILVGTLSGSMGAFMPPDRGIAFLAPGMPLNLQATALACTFYHLAAHDPHLIGAYLRGLPLLHLSEPDNLKALTIFFFVAMAFLSLIKGPDFNPFAPVHRFLYDLLGVPLSPATEERLKASGRATTRRSSAAAAAAVAAAASESSKWSWLEVSKVVVPLLAILFYQFNGRVVPRTSLAVHSRLNPGEWVAACGLVQQYAGACEQHFLTVDAEGTLSLYRGASPRDTASQRLWQSKNKRKGGKLSDAGYFAELQPEGVFVLKHTGDDSTPFWSSKANGGGAKKNPRVRVLERGAFGVFDGNGEALWTSDGQMNKELF